MRYSDFRGLRRLVLLHVLVASLLASCGGDPEPIPVAPPVAADAPAPEADAFEAAETWLRAPAGTVLRSGPEADADSVGLVEADRRLLVLARSYGSYRVAKEDGSPLGWVRVRNPDVLRILTPPLGPRPSVSADPVQVAEIRSFLRAGGRRADCGPWQLWTDVGDSAILAALDSLAARLDEEYAARLGVAPAIPEVPVSSGFWRPLERRRSLASPGERPERPRRQIPALADRNGACVIASRHRFPSTVMPSARFIVQAESYGPSSE